MRVVVLVAVLIAPAALAEPSGELGLQDAIKLALTRNERAAIADLNVVVADAGVDKARVAFLPILAATGSDTYRPRDKPIDVAQGALQLNQPLLAPSAFPLYEQAKHQLEGTRAQTVDDRRTLEFDAAKAFFNVLLANEVLLAAQKKLDTAKAEVKDTGDRVTAALNSSNDLTRAQIDLGSSQRELASDQGLLDTAKVQLVFVLNAPITGGLAAPTALLAMGNRALPAVDGLVAKGLAKRPDLVARKDDGLAAHDFAREPRMRYLPTVGLTGTLSDTSNPPTGGHNVDATALVSATWTIFDAGSRSADARGRDAQAAIADLTTLALARTIEEQIRAAAATLGAAQQELVAAQVAMDASRKSSTETAILYKQGLAKAIELVDANETRFENEVGYAEAQFDVASAYLGLRQAMGYDPIGEDL